MKNLALLATLVFTAFPVISYSQNPIQPAKPDIEQYGLVGPVETFRYEWAAFSTRPDRQGEYKERKRNYVETVTFDTNGKLILRDPPRYRCGMSWAVGTHIPTYDKKGNLIEELTYDYRGLFSGRSTFKYDDTGNRIEFAYYGTRGLMWVHKYDADGREVERARYEGGSLEDRRVYLRNKQGNVIEILTYKEDGSLKEREISTYEYDEKSNWIKRVYSECIANDKSPCKPTRADYRSMTYHSERN